MLTTPFILFVSSILLPLCNNLKKLGSQFSLGNEPRDVQPVIGKARVQIHACLALNSLYPEHHTIPNLEVAPEILLPPRTIFLQHFTLFLLRLSSDFSPLGWGSPDSPQTPLFLFSQEEC